MKRALLFIIAVMFTSSAYAEGSFNFFRHKGVNPDRPDIYSESCGECHFAYPAGLLPERSWRKMLLPEQLEDHFGENAELPDDDRQAVLKYLVDNAADSSSAFIYKRSRKFDRSIPSSETPLQITKTEYFKRKHKKIPEKYVKPNPKVRSYMNCNNCHKEAKNGVFDDDTVLIPNFGYWSDLE